MADAADAPGRLAELAETHALGPAAREGLERLLALLATAPDAPTSVTHPAAAVDVHLADSLAALALAEVRAADRVADIGAGAGLPGLVLALALGAEVALVEASARKCAFLRRAVAATGSRSVAVVHARVEQWSAGAGCHDLVVARALGPAPVVLEYAAPLLAPGGHLVDWRGRRDPGAARAAAAAAGELGLEAVEVRAVRPYPASRNRHLHVWRKTAPTPARFPRRPGIARKRPLGAN